MVKPPLFERIVAPLAVLCCAAAWVAGLPAAEPAGIEFNRDIRPILSDNCFQCHGPDKAQRKADLRLDTEEGALADLGGRRAIVPGDPESSELIARIGSSDPDERMPPSGTGKRLTPQQIDLVRRWIAQGATWQGHWSFIPPSRPRIPRVTRQDWVRNPIDAFVLAQLEREGLEPSAEAPRATLLRRVTLDLTGLPPVIEEVDAFLADKSADAYERAVDRLLNSARFGERMASRWLDGARYADTNGYQSDGERFMWRWRDWVIEAFNSNMPFDQFTVEQLAGDMLPNPTLDQLIATGFNRNHRGNGEGGIIPEEYAVEYVVDRVETTATVWLGLTMGCGRCHEHKFDPISQREFYGVFAYFNNVPEYGRAVKFGNSPPLIKAPTKDQQTRLANLDRQVRAAEERFAYLADRLEEAQLAWERQADLNTMPDWSVTRAQLVHLPLDGSLHNLAPAAAPQQHAAPAATPAGTAGPATNPVPEHPSMRQGEALFAPGRMGQAAAFDGQRFIEAPDLAAFGYDDKFTLAAWVLPEAPATGTIISRMTDTHRADGYALVLEQGRPQLNLVKRWLDDALRVEADVVLEPKTWHHLLVTYDGSRLAAGVKMYVNGQPVAVRVLLDMLNQSFASKEPLRVGAGNGPMYRFRGLIDDVRIYADALAPQEARLVAVADPVARILAQPAAQRDEGQRQKLRAMFLERFAPDDLRQAHQAVVALARQRERMIEGFPTTMVMQEMPRPRPTHLLIRGVYDRPGEPVEPGIPQALAQPMADRPADRLAFARWLVSPANPLTARVTVNRYWQMLFGTGLVKTVDDFGAQGEWPSHPELLDWLAVEFMAPPAADAGAASGVKRHAWDLKALLRLMVTSATYRQSSALGAAGAQRDPENRLLARGPRYRLPAEMVRDSALFAAGLLVESVGGPSVKPYQPEGLWKELGDVDYVQDHGEALYRRSLYTFWKRTVAPPTMVAFDAAGRETCIVREQRTNTPLQALALMNETTFVEAARCLAERVLAPAGQPDEARLARAFRLVLSRPPRAAELNILEDALAQHRARFRAQPAAADELTSVGERPRAAGLNVAELAAYSAVCGMLLNLDEAITKE